MAREPHAALKELCGLWRLSRAFQIMKFFYIKLHYSNSISIRVKSLFCVNLVFPSSISWIGLNYRQFHLLFEDLEAEYVSLRDFRKR